MQVIMPAMMRQAFNTSLIETLRETPTPGAKQILVWIHAFAVCPADLHVVDGGFAEYLVADQHYCFLVPASYSNCTTSNQVDQLYSATVALLLRR